DRRSGEARLRERTVRGDVARRFLLFLRDDVHPRLAGQPIALRIAEAVAQARLDLRLIVCGIGRGARSGGRIERLEDAEGARETGEARRRVRDLRLPVGVDVADADAAQAGVAR